MTDEVTQYTQLTYYFVRNFSFVDGPTPMCHFQLYDSYRSMSLADFCEVLGLPYVGRIAVMNGEPPALWDFSAPLVAEARRASAEAR